MPACFIAILSCVITFVFPTFSVFEVVDHEYPFVFSVMSIMPSSQECILGWRTSPLPRLDQMVLSRLTGMMMSSEGPFFSIALERPTLSLHDWL